MGMNGLLTRRDRLHTIGRLYSSLENTQTVRDISFDETGVVAFCGSQGTNHVWYGERIDFTDETATYRILKLEPTRVKGVHPSKRTGMPEFGVKLTTVRYVIGDVTIPRRTQQASLGAILRDVQTEFRHVQRSNPKASGNVNSDREVESLYSRFFVSG
jgi:hypothetical protein